MVTEDLKSAYFVIFFIFKARILKIQLKDCKARSCILYFVHTAPYKLQNFGIISRFLIGFGDLVTDCIAVCL